MIKNLFRKNNKMDYDLYLRYKSEAYFRYLEDMMCLYPNINYSFPTVVETQEAYNNKEELLYDILCFLGFKRHDGSRVIYFEEDAMKRRIYEKRTKDYEYEDVVKVLKSTLKFLNDNRIKFYTEFFNVYECKKEEYLCDPEGFIVEE